MERHERLDRGADRRGSCRRRTSAAQIDCFTDDGHALDFINKAFECLDLIGFDHAAELLPSLLRVLASGQGAEESTATVDDMRLLPC